MTLTLELPFEALYILYLLQKNKLEAYIVGGAVRDLILQSQNENHSLTISDYDFATNASPETIQALIKDSYYENEFGMVGIGYDHLLEQIEQAFGSIPKENLKTQLNLQPEKKQRVIDILNAKKIHSSLQKKQLKNTGDITEKEEVITPHPLEITSYRSEEVYQDFRRPSELKWGKNINEDLKRRDFTINALALSVDFATLEKILQSSLQTSYQLSADQYQVTDLFAGLTDLKNQVIKTVGPADERFSEDALRMLRAIRFSVQLGFSLDQTTLESIKSNQQLITHISWERIQAEFLKMLASEQPKKAIELLDETGLLTHILPELLAAKGVEQAGHHTTDVWTHSLEALETCPSKDPVVRLATLLHDIGKPATFQKQSDNITFYSHDIVSSRMASKIAQRLRFSKEQSQRLFTLVRFHMFYYQPNHTDAAIRRFMRKVGLENIDDILDLREGDRLGSGARKTSWRLEEMKQRMIEQLNQPLDVTDLAINGHDLIKELNLKPGPILGLIMKRLLEMVLDQPELNTKDLLLTEAKKIVKDTTSGKES